MALIYKLVHCQVLTSSFGYGRGPNEEVLAFVNENDGWVTSQVAALGEDNDYWLAVNDVHTLRMYTVCLTLCVCRSRRSHRRWMAY